MAISYNTGTSSSASAVPHTTQPTLTIPAGVLAGDLMLAAVNMFTFTPTGAGITLTPAAGSWTQTGGGLQTSGAAGGVTSFGAVWKRVATGADAGTTLTFAFTGTPGSTDQFWWTPGIVAYTGAADVDVSGGTGSIASPQTVACPTLTTGVSGDWAVFIGCMGDGSGGALTGVPSGSTQRINQGNSGINLGISDSNASVGTAGTSIGGGFFDTANNVQGWSTVFTAGVEPPGTPAPPPAGLYSMRAMP